MRDHDVKELVKKYPSNYVNIKQFIKEQKGHFSQNNYQDELDLSGVPENVKKSKVYQKIQNEEQEKKNQKRKLLAIMRQCQKVEGQWPQEKNETEYNQLLEQVRF